MHKNRDDVYSASAKTAGFQKRFDKDQKSYGVFLYLAEVEGFNPISTENLELLTYESFDEAESGFLKKDCQCKV